MMNLKRLSKGSVYLLIALILGIVLVMASGYTGEKAPELQLYETCEKRCEDKLEAMLCQLDGIDRAEVMVTLDEIPSGKIRPRVRGVAVVLHGKAGDSVRYQAVMLIVASLGLTSDKIFVTFSK